MALDGTALDTRPPRENGNLPAPPDGDFARSFGGLVARCLALARESEYDFLDRDGLAPDALASLGLLVNPPALEVKE